MAFKDKMFYYLKKVILGIKKSKFMLVLDLVSQVCDVVLMNVYLDLGNPGGSGFWSEGYMSKGRGKWEDQFTSNLGTRWTDPITAKRVPSK
jgi:hypothetical protein